MANFLCLWVGGSTCWCPRRIYFRFLAFHQLSQWHFSISSKVGLWNYANDSALYSYDKVFQILWILLAMTLLFCQNGSTIISRFLNEIKKNQFSNNFNKNQAFFWFFTENLTLLHSVPSWAGANIDLPPNSNFSKTARVNIALTWTFFKEYLISFLMMFKLIDFALVVL